MRTILSPNPIANHTSGEMTKFTSSKKGQRLSKTRDWVFPQLSYVEATSYRPELAAQQLDIEDHMLRDSNGKPYSEDKEDSEGEKK